MPLLRPHPLPQSPPVHIGHLSGVAAFLMWGLLPIYWKQLEAVPSLQLVAHRVIWSTAVFLPLLVWWGGWSQFRDACSRPEVVRRQAVAAVLVAANWLGFVWAVTHGRMVESSLGYFLTPLVSVILGVVVLGERAADFLNAEAGGTIELGQGTYHVAGVVRLENGFENGGVFMPLGTCQRAFHKEGVSSVITVALAEGHEASEVKDWMAAHHERLTALENEEFSRSYSQFKIMKTTAWVVGGCAFLLGGLSVTNTMILSVFGRIKELAIARVCGFSRGQVARMIFGESLLVSAIGTALGWGLSTAGLYALRAVPQLQGYIEPRIGWAEVAGALSLAVVTALAGALYPAWYAANLKPAEALRFE